MFHSGSLEMKEPQKKLCQGFVNAVLYIVLSTLPGFRADLVLTLSFLVHLNPLS